MKRLVGLGAGILLGAIACGGGVDTKDPESGVGRSESPLVCSAAGSYSVALTGTQQYIYGADYKCSGVVLANETAKVDITPGAVAGHWLVRFGYYPTTWTVTETNGIIDWSYQSAATDANKVGCAGGTGSIQLRVDESTIMVRHSCRWLSGTSGCTRYSSVTGTMARACTPPPPPDPDAGGEPAEPDAGSTSDASTTEPALDSGAPTSGSGDSPATGSTPSDPPAPPESSSGASSSTSSPSSAASPVSERRAGEPVSCGVSAAGSASSSFALALAGAIAVAFVKRRRAKEAFPTVDDLPCGPMRAPK